jgi:transposase
MMKHDSRWIELNMDEIEDILGRAREKPISDEEYKKLKAAMETLAHFTEMVGNKDATINKLRKILFGPSTEKTRDIVGKEVGPAGKDAVSSETRPSETAGESPREKPKGHGRNGAAAYTGADRVSVKHESLKPGQRCPKCLKGKIYQCKEPALLVRITGRAPIQATVYAMERLRCNLCGEVFTAEAPEGVGPAKWDEEAKSMVGMLRYGAGFPFNRLARLQKNLGIPLPASTQWAMVNEGVEAMEPAFEELLRQGAQGEILHNDDTSARILEIVRKRREREQSEEVDDPKERTGMFTSGIVSIAQERKIALFFTGQQHAGENLRDVLLKRAEGLRPPIQMCDGSSRNEPDLPEEFEVILSNCNVHARRQFVDVANQFPEECRHVLEVFRDVYHNDKKARLQGMTAEERQAFHKVESGPRMEELKSWMAEQLDEKKVESNSSLGKAIKYTQKRWEQLTRFLEIPGVPLDNNAAEQILKKVILSRKNSYFYKTVRGAHVGDVYMSLIHTAELAKENPFDYLTQLQKHSKEVKINPSQWMPWNYRETIRRIETAKVSQA